MGNLMLTAIMVRVKEYAASAIGALIFLTFAYFRARQDGKNAAEAAQAKKQAEAIKRKKTSDDQIDSMGVDARRDELRKWLRDDKL